MFGPGLALRGPEGPISMHKSIEVLQKQSKVTFYFFMISLVFFLISSFLVVWIYYPGIIAVIVNVVLVYCLVMFGRNGVQIWKKLYVTDVEAVTGQFTDFSAYEQMPDLDRVNRAEEEKLQSQGLIEERQGAAQAETGAFDFGIVNAIKRAFNR
eukprot:TRINITY_DN5612_c0_g2_i1.p2 TRINITY_DN5612_c0_g2~~TRINITY_DN5612_c0_g2_i1.p2  ORF type:complete len:154 (+),score=46.18 TRINITY_DN5612_c0_g2_i1:424-885(+)